MGSIFTRHEKNPILTIDDLSFDAHAILNPGATEHDGDIVLLVRIEDNDGFSSIHVARSKDGISNWKIDSKAILQRGEAGWRYEEWGCEDARVTYIPEMMAWYITYTAYSPAGEAVGLARTTDFVSAERLGLIFPPNNKDAVLFPTRFDNRWAALHRPDAGGVENIWIAYSHDFIYWGEPHAVLLEGMGPAWDAAKVGSGPPPIETKDGWLLIYHGAKYYAGSLVYRAGAVLLDRYKPHKIKASTPVCIFRGSALYEQAGLVPNSVFPTGLIQRGDELWMYYGAADTSVCLAIAKLQDLLDSLEPGPVTRR
ncbi:MAG: glycosidase [Syntrophales bacterium]